MSAALTNRARRNLTPQVSSSTRQISWSSRQVSSGNRQVSSTICRARINSAF